MWVVVIFVVSLLLKLGDAGNHSYVITKRMARFCKEHTCRDGYGYKTFYRVDDEDLKEIKKDSDIAFEMHIGIQGASNGHILLSPVQNPGENDPVYEIVVGGGLNPFTEIRRQVKRHSMVSKPTPGILSPYEMRGFYIRISRDGFIEFGNEGDVLPLLAYKDLSPLEIKYFSFSTWYGVVVQFLYDCPAPNMTEPTMDSQAVEPPPLSPKDQLKQMQLTYRQPWVAPRPDMEVTLGVKVTSVKYNVFDSKVNTAMSVVVSWKDDSLAWYPPKFNGTTSLKFRLGQIWRPKFYVFNSDSDVFDTKKFSLITVMSNGEATFHFQTKTVTWCYDSPSGYSKWPHDDYMCSIVIQPFEVHDKITIESMDPEDKRMQVYADIDNVIQNEWEVSTKQYIIHPSIWNQIYVSDDNQTHQSDRLVITLHLVRRPTSYNIVFYTPLLVLLMFILMSFWTDPLKMERVWFYTGCIIIINMGLCYIDYLIPCHTMPSILVLYMTVLAGVLLAILIQVALMLSVTEKFCNTNAMQKILNSAIFRVVFCLPPVTGSDNGGYTIQDDDDTENLGSRGSDVEEMEKENELTRNNTREFAEVIDRILFFVYTITFGVMLASHF